MKKAGPKRSTRTKASTGKTSTPRRSKPKSLSAMNAWVISNHSALLKAARQNCVRLTGKPTFGGSSRRQSA